tara:strand:- start:1025 stop:1570 length:546 start_codon:yes stop_codon:yes gene_type:complete
MKYLKIIILIISVLFAAVILFFAYATMFPASPLQTTTYSSENATYEVEYSSPFKKDRLIFGNESEGALVPFGKYWRTGANAATTFSTSEDITFGGESLQAGKYSLYTIPGKEKWTIALNSVNDTFFAIAEADQDEDVLRISSKSIKISESVEQFSIDFSADSLNTYLNLKWDKTLVSIPLK